MAAEEKRVEAKPEPARRPLWRRILPWVLIVLAAIILLVAALNVWVKRQALDTGNWVDTSSQLLEDDDIRGAISLYLVDQLYSNVDVTARLEQRLPNQFDGLAAPLAVALRQLAVRSANELLARPRVQRLWQEANRRAHTLFEALVNDDLEALQTTNGQVVLDLRPILQSFSREEGYLGRVADRLPPDAGRIVLMQESQLENVRTLINVVEVLSFFLALLALALLVLAVFIARGQRRVVLMGAGIAVLLVGLIVLVVRRIVGGSVVNALVDNPDFEDAASSAWLIGTGLLRNVAINLVVYGAVVIVATWLAGPSRPARAIRRFLAPTLREHPVVVYGVVAFGLLLFLLLGPRDLSRLIPLLILFAFAFLGVEVFRRQTEREFPAGPPPVAP
jgi:F0F1-type ATP synthase membrane subunit c/vacuolar-type H+-ATPase subunit K